MKRSIRNDKLGIRGKNKPGKPGIPVSRGIPTKTLPQWMWGDPVEVVERLESIEARAEERERILQIERAEQAREIERAFYERMQVCRKRVVLAPPEIRIKQLRIQALARAARMKEQK